MNSFLKCDIKYYWIVIIIFNHIFLENICFACYTKSGLGLFVELFEYQNGMYCVWVICVAATLRYSEQICRKQLLYLILTNGQHGLSLFREEAYRCIYIFPISIFDVSITACIDSHRPKNIGWMLRASLTEWPGLRYIATFILRCTANRSMDTYCQMSNHVSEMPLNRSKHLNLNGVIWTRSWLKKEQ